MTDVDLTDFGLEEPSGPDVDNEVSETDSGPRWPECDSCGYVGREVKARLIQRVPLCTACFAEREGLL